MINNINSPICFGAKALKTLKYNNINALPEKVSFVEINPKCERDKKGFETLLNDWKHATFVRDIYEDVFDSETKNSKTTSKVFALTKQRKNLKNLEGKQILGIIEVSTYDKSTPYIEYLEVKPTMQNANIGSTILNVMKKIYNSLELNSTSMAQGFYEKNEFKIINPVNLRYKWIKTKNNIWPKFSTIKSAIFFKTSN